MAFSRPWKKSELEALKRMAAEGENVTVIAHRLERTNEAVKARARALGLEINSVIGRPRA